MKAVCFDGTLKVCDIPMPARKSGEVLIRVSRAGICNTDHEITRGYVPGFRGVLGHEFFGYVKDADDTALLGRCVTAKINNACGICEFCTKGLGKHCSNRTVLGIINRDGAMSEYISVPKENVVEITPDIPDTNAIFIEPLAAALEILEQVHIGKEHSVLLIGDGKLALLIALVMQTTGCDLTVLGKHPEKLAIAGDAGITTVLLEAFRKSAHDVVIEASGNPSAFQLGLECLKPCGTLVLKSTYAGGFTFNPSSIVVNEITLIGSRCGRFTGAIRFLEQHNPPLEKLISAEYPLAEALAAFKRSEQPEALKVVLRVEG